MYKSGNTLRDLMLKRIFLLYFFLISGLLLSATELPKTAREESYYLTNAIDRIVQQVDPYAHVGIEIVSLKSGQKLYERNALKMFTPASVQKLFTAAAALGILGPNFHFETHLYADRPVDHGILDGNLYFKGSGDPSLTSEHLQNLVFQLTLHGLKTIRGDLLIDHYDFDTVTQGPGWMWDEGAEYWNSPIDGLLVNHSSIAIWVEPGEAVGSQAKIVAYPEVEEVTIQNLVTTSEKPGKCSVSRRWMTKENVIEVEGVIEQKCSPKRYDIPLETPSLYAAQLLRNLLHAQGVQLLGKIHYRKTPDGAVSLAKHSSKPLAELIHPILKQSDNLYSNCLFKKMGQNFTQTLGTWQNGEKALRSFLAHQANLDAANLVLKDGDGESRYNLVSPHQLVVFLTWMQNQFPYFPEFLAALPSSGIDGTLTHRLESPTVKGRIRAKTGSMTGVSALSGYIQTQDGEWLAFAILINGFIKPAEEYKKNLEDRICTLLAEFTRAARPSKD